jgi:hypothetical protein
MNRPGMKRMNLLKKPDPILIAIIPIALITDGAK